MTHAPTTPPPEGLRDTCDVCPAPANCWREPEGTAACSEHHDHPTVRPEKGPCGRIHLAGFPCPTCAAPQWVDWPTHAGWWWMHFMGTTVDRIVQVDEHLRVFEGRPICGFARGDIGPGFRFLDARLTPPAPPEAR